MRILALGTMFGGTTRFYNALCAAGYNVGHNAVRPDGMVRCVPRKDYMFYLSGYDFILHLVCSPSQVLPRLFEEAPMSLSRAQRVHYAETQYIEVNRYISSLADKRLRVEYMGEDWPRELYKPAQFTRHRDLCKPRPTIRLNENVRALAREYGYDI